jgi:hypothetical protein
MRKEGSRRTKDLMPHVVLADEVAQQFLVNAGLVDDLYPDGQQTPSLRTVCLESRS